MDDKFDDTFLREAEGGSMSIGDGRTSPLIVTFSCFSYNFDFATSHNQFLHEAICSSWGQRLGDPWIDGPKPMTKQYLGLDVNWANIWSMRWEGGDSSQESFKQGGKQKELR